MRDRLPERPVCAAGQPACRQMSRRVGLSGSDREFPVLTGRSGHAASTACSSRTSGAAGRLAVVPASSVSSRSRRLAAVRGRCCTWLLYCGCLIGSGAGRGAHQPAVRFPDVAACLFS